MNDEQRHRHSEMQRGSRNSNWRRDTPSYGAAHRNVVDAKGTADQYVCEHCDGNAKEWAYDHTNAQEERVEVGRLAGRLYSMIVADYIPLCISCHRRYDWRISRR